MVRHTPLYGGGVCNLPPHVSTNNLKGSAHAFTFLKGIGRSKKDANSRSNSSPECPAHKKPLDLYCNTCHLPVCGACINSHHSGHDWCEICQIAEVNKKLLELVHKDTNALLKRINGATIKTKEQAHNSEKDINLLCEGVKWDFKLMHEQLEKREKNILKEIEVQHSKVEGEMAQTAKKQEVMAQRVESMIRVQSNLEKSGDYELATCTNSCLWELNSQPDIPHIEWTSKLERKISSDGFIKKSKVYLLKRDEISGEHFHQKDRTNHTRKILLQIQDQQICSLVVYKKHIYVAYYSAAIQCYSSDGTIISTYEFADGYASIEGMCLIHDGAEIKLILTDTNNAVLYWIHVDENHKMIFDHDQALDYRPRGIQSDKGEILVCDSDNHAVYVYTCDGSSVCVINLSGEVKPGCITGQIKNNYIITDMSNDHVMLIDRDGNIKSRFSGKHDKVTFGEAYDVKADTLGRVLIVDNAGQQVLLMTLSDQDDVRKVWCLLDKNQVKHPTSVCLDPSSQDLYVAGRDLEDVQHVFIYDYPVLTAGLDCVQNTTCKLDFKLQLLG